MRWDDERESSNVEDVRGEGPGVGLSGGGQGVGGFGGGGGGGLGLLFGLLPLLGRGGGVVAVIVVLAVVFGPRLLSGGGAAPSGSASSGFQGAPPTPAAQVSPGGEDEDLRFIRKVTAYTEDTWTRVFQDQGRTYRPPIVTVYSNARTTGCGLGQSAMGPFYCPADHHVYLDPAFFQQLSGRFGAPGRFAQAYVIAHEVGHHVQTLLGTTARVDAQRQGLSGEAANPLSVRTELQADCYAGVWANQTNRATQFLDPADEAEGLRAASAVGDDTLQRETQGRVAPDSFTHGSSAQRTRWFDRGFKSGDMSNCDTFAGAFDAL